MINEVRLNPYGVKVFRSIYKIIKFKLFKWTIFLVLI